MNTLLFNWFVFFFLLNEYIKMKKKIYIVKKGICIYYIYIIK